MEDKIKVKAIIDEEVYYPIEIDIPRKELTLAEAKELAERLQAEIEIAEWDAMRKSHSVK